MRLLREPLLHFVGIALVIVGAERFHAIRHDRFRIVMTSERVTQVVAAYRLQFGIEPGPDLREALVQQEFEDEVLYRQALALGLDADDEIIRRRLIQKMRFVTEDQQAPAEPGRAELESYFSANREKYRTSPRATFTHAFFSADVRGDAPARRSAQAEIEQLNRSGALRAQTSGDPFPDLYDFSLYDPQQVARLFGNTELSTAVFSAPVGQWTGPFRSAYGWHVLRVDTRQPAGEPTFADVADRVRGDYLEAQQARANARALSTMKQQFRLVRNDLAP